MGLFDKIGDFLSGKQTATTEPWKPAQTQLKNILNHSRDMFQSGGFETTPYQGERVSPYSAMTQSGINMLGGIQGQTPAMRNAMTGMIANGGGRYGNPALTEMLDGDTMYRDFDTIRKTVGDQTQARLAGVFAGGGINSSLAQDTYARGLGEALAGVEYGAYNDAQNRRLAALGIDASGFDNAQNRRLSALGLAPEMQGMDMRAAGARLTGGGLTDDYNQRVIDANMDRYYEGEDANMNALMRYSALVSGIGGMGGSQTANTGLPLGGLGNLLSGGGSAMTAAATLFDRGGN